MLEKVGNIEDIMMEAFEECMNKNTDDSWGFNNKPHSSVFKAEESLNDFVKGYSVYCKGSWYTPKLGDTQFSKCTAWHKDGGLHTHVMIASCNNPTEFLVKGSEHFDETFSALCYDDRPLGVYQKKVEDLVAEGNAEIFQPKLGDVYIMSKDIIHRTSPKAYDNPHLVLRLFLQSQNETLNPLDKMAV